MNDAERYRKEQDLIFQEIEEKAKLKEQASEREFAVRIQRKLRDAHVSTQEWADMVVSGKTPAEIDNFLEAKIQAEFVKWYMADRAARGKPPISGEKALALLRMAEEKALAED